MALTTAQWRLGSAPMFSDGPLSDHLGRQVDRLQKEAAALPIDQVADEEQAVSYLCKKYQLEGVDLQEPTTKVEDSPPNRAVVRVMIPITGSAWVLRFVPSASTSNPPDGEIVDFHSRGGPFIRLQHGPFPPGDLEADTVRRWREQEVESVRKWTAWTNQDLEQFSSQVVQVARQAVTQRKALLARQQQLRDELS
jgi:hypothetical protein